MCLLWCRLEARWLSEHVSLSATQLARTGHTSPTERASLLSTQPTPPTPNSTARLPTEAAHASPDKDKDKDSDKEKDKDKEKEKELPDIQSLLQAIRVRP
jgi:hypothetical protein